MMKMNKWSILVIVAVSIISIYVLVNFVDFGADTTKGIKYIKNQEKLETSEIESDLETLRQNEVKDAQENDTIDSFALLNDYVIIGDSRALGFSSYGFLPETNVLANTGDTVLKLSDWTDDLKSLQPTNIYISYGANDITNNLDGLEGGYKEVYASEVKKVLEVCPNANIYINSIIPFSDTAISNNAALADYETYNNELKDMCETYGWTYIDNSSLVSGSDYQSDGIHFASTVYSAWAANMTSQN